MTDVRAWAAEVVAEMDGDDVISILSEGADAFGARLDRLRSPGFEDDDALAVVDDIERLCSERVVLPPDEEDETELDPEE
jgi:hypothetical protein